MPRSKVIIRLNEIHGDISAFQSSDSCDTSTVQSFGDLVKDIKGFVEREHESNRSEAGDGDERVEPEPNVSTGETHTELKDRIAEFETSHPKITSFLTEITELLASIGI